MQAKRLLITFVTLSFCTHAFGSSLIPIGDIAFSSQLKGLTGLTTDKRGSVIGPLAKVPTDDLLAVLGSGFDIFSNTIKPDAPCIEAVRDDEKFGFEKVGQSSSHEFIQTVSDMQENDSASGSSFGFDFTYDFVTVGASSGSKSSNYLNTVDEFGRVFSSIVTKGAMRVGGKWSNNADAIRGNAKKFNEVCGTHYVKGIFWGHQIDETLKFSLNKQNYTSSDESGFSLGVTDLLGVSFSESSAATKVSSMSKVSIISESRGVLGVKQYDPNVPGGVKGLVNYARYDFPKLVAASQPDQSSILYLDIEPYYLLNVPGTEKFPRFTDELISVIENRVPLYSRLVSAMSDNLFAQDMVKTSPSGFAEFYNETDASLAQKYKDAETVQLKFRKEMETCRGYFAAGDDTSADKCKQGLLGALAATDVAAAQPLRK